MAKMYKTLNNCFIEDAGQAGNWNSFLKINRQADLQSQSSGVVSKVRISYIQQDQTTDAANGRAGIMFVASINDTLSSTAAEDNDDYIMAATAGRLEGGVLTLNLDNYRIRDNAEDLGRKDGPLWIFCRTTDLDSTDNTEVSMVIETHGRWITTSTI